MSPLTRWYLLHWLVLHLVVVILLFVTSTLVFVVQRGLWKLLGLLPLSIALLTMFCWAKVCLCARLLKNPTKLKQN